MRKRVDGYGVVGPLNRAGVSDSFPCTPPSPGTRLPEIDSVVTTVNISRIWNLPLTPTQRVQVLLKKNKLNK